MLFYLYPLLFLVHIISEPLLAKESLATPAVVGHKPKISDLQLDKQNVYFGDTVSVKFNYSDLDGDPIGKTDVKWSLASLVMNGEKIIMQKDIKKTTCEAISPNTPFSVVVTPVSISGEPLIGDPITIQGKVLEATPINGFYMSSKKSAQLIEYDRPGAITYCRSLGKKLPTASQARAFIQYYNQIVPLGVSSILGWPSERYAPLCGGKTEAYWTSDVGGGAGYYTAISINNAALDTTVQESAKAYVMCVP